jgi:hypothetical protein
LYIFFSIVAVDNKERFCPCANIRGTNIIIKPKIIKIKISTIPTVAERWLNFSRFFEKKSKIGFPISVSIKENNEVN